jgi:hypothetical protein
VAVSDVALDREITTLESEKKMSELALKAHQKSLAAQLKGSMGKDINRTIKKEKKETFWDKIDKFLKML